MSRAEGRPNQELWKFNENTLEEHQRAWIGCRQGVGLQRGQACRIIRSPEVERQHLGHWATNGKGDLDQRGWSLASRLTRRWSMKRKIRLVGKDAASPQVQGCTSEEARTYLTVHMKLEGSYTCSYNFEVNRSFYFPHPNEKQRLKNIQCQG